MKGDPGLYIMVVPAVKVSEFQPCGAPGFSGEASDSIRTTTDG